MPTIFPDDIEQTLLDGLSSEKGLALTKDIVTFSTPVKVDLEQHNTQITLTVGEDSSNSIDLLAYYNRLDLEELFSSVDKNLEDTGETKLSELIARISITRGIVFTISQHFDDYQIILPAGSVQLPILIKAKENSLLFTGSTTFTFIKD